MPVLFRTTFSIFRNIAGFIGPEGPDCSTEAMVAGSKNRAMISYRCTDVKISGKDKYPTFTRMEPPDTQVTSSVLSLLDYYKWKKFSLIFQEGSQWEAIAKYLNDQAIKKGFHLNHYVKFKDQSSCCIRNLKCCSSVRSLLSISYLRLTSLLFGRSMFDWS